MLVAPSVILSYYVVALTPTQFFVASPLQLRRSSSRYLVPPGPTTSTTRNKTPTRIASFRFYGVLQGSSPYPKKKTIQGPGHTTCPRLCTHSTEFSTQCSLALPRYSPRAELPLPLEIHHTNTLQPSYYMQVEVPAPASASAPASAAKTGPPTPFISRGSLPHLITYRTSRLKPGLDFCFPPGPSLLLPLSKRKHPAGLRPVPKTPAEAQQSI